MQKVLFDVRRKVWAPWALAAGLLGLMSGCVTMGRPFATDQVPSIVIGRTTQAEIQKIFGEPYRTGIESGDTTWTYLNYHFSILGNQQTTDLYVRFASDGTVKSYALNTNVPENNPRNRR